MGEFFVNFQIRSGDAQEVAAVAAGAVRGLAYISPEAGRWVSLYDRTAESQDVYEIDRVATEISGALGTIVLVFLVADTTMLVYYVFDSGGLIDEYHSTLPAFPDGPEIGEHPRFGGRPEVLIPLCRPGVLRVDIDSALEKSEISHDAGFGSTVPATDRILLLANALGIDVARATIGYDGLHAMLRTLPDAAAYFQVDGRRQRRSGGRVPPKLK
jgi:hypothetical protein